MKKIVSVFVLTCILFGCKKSSTEDEYYTINGIVIDYDSKLPIAGAKVYAGPLCIGGCTTAVCLKTTVAFSNIAQFKAVVFWSAIDFQ